MRGLYCLLNSAASGLNAGKGVRWFGRQVVGELTSGDEFAEKREG